MLARIPLLVAVLVLVLSAARVAPCQQQGAALDEKGVQALLGLGLDEETIVARIEKGPVAFEVTDAVVAKLKAAGASEKVVAALQAAAKARPAPAAKTEVPITYEQVLQLISLGLDEATVLQRIAKTPPIFTLGAAQEDELVKAGATPKVLAALKGDRPAAPAARDITDLALILDCSGSMQELTKEGETKMEAAKRIVADLVKKIPAGLNLTFVVYGHEVFGGADDPRNCQAVKVVRPLGPLDEAGRAALLKYIATIKPTGATPIANAMRLAGTELAKNDALCGMVVLTDGLESCRGNPAGEAADLLANLKISFGVNVIGFGVKDADDVALAAIAEAGNGKYYNADSSEELAERMLSLATELIAVAKPPEVIDTSRRAVRVLKPEVDLPEMKSITLIEEKEAGSAVRTQLGSVDKYDDYLRIPSGTTKYAVLWEPKEGFSVFLLRDFSIPERRVIDVKPDTVLGMIQVDGTGDAKEIYAVKAGERSAVVTKVQQAKKYGEIMVVPAGKYDVYVDRSRIEEDLEVEAGKLVRLK